ncbi:ROK family protein [Nocardia fluminea]|uniref:Glucokinase n=1 Tax=Nocardia fluminea TaxID=134984 RepID=A0A2N3VC71_9NOCA|nr:ROK family protein [Nocardia fluminea]PKV79209.1 glucokinase [Nocardia fluminea]
MKVLALDIGATKFAAGVVDPHYRLHGVRRVAAACDDPWATCRDLLVAVADDNEVSAVGIGAAGPVDVPAGMIRPLNLAAWRGGFAVVEHVRALFPKAVVRLAIDGACLVLAEHRVGGLRGVDNGLALTVSSGVGGGIVADGRVVLGRTGNAGHLGHIVVPGDDTACPCGGFGCVEAVASGMSSVRWARSRGWVGETGKELAEAAHRGDRIALAAMARAGTALGQGISSAAALLDVDRVVISGGFAQSGEPLWGPLRAAVARHSRLEFVEELSVRLSTLSEGATLVGAGVLAVEAGSE